MSWVKIDDKMTSHPKVVAAGNAAVGAWVRMLAYAGLHLTDGRIPGAMVKSIASSKEIAALVRVGLLRLVEGGDYQLHDYLEWNPPASDVRAARQARSDAGARGGKASAMTRRTKQNVTNGQANTEALASRLASPLFEAKTNPVPVSDPDLRSSPPEPLVPDCKSAPVPEPASGRFLVNSEDSERAEQLRAKALADADRLSRDPSFHPVAAGGRR